MTEHIADAFPIERAAVGCAWVCAATLSTWRRAAASRMRDLVEAQVIDFDIVTLRGIV